MSFIFDIYIYGFIALIVCGVFVKILTKVIRHFKKDNVSKSTINQIESSNIPNKSHVFLEVGDKVVSLNKNEVDGLITNINDLLKNCIEEIIKSYSNNATATNYLNSIKNFVLTEVSVSASEKYLLLTNDNKKHTFALHLEKDGNFTIFYVELYPNSMTQIKYSQFQGSYLDSLNDICMTLYKQTGMTIQQFQNSTFLHIMFFITENMVECEIGIKSVKFDFGHAPIDLLSKRDHNNIGL